MKDINYKIARITEKGEWEESNYVIRVGDGKIFKYLNSRNKIQNDNTKTKKEK